MPRRRITAGSYESLLRQAHQAVSQQEAVILAPTRSAGEDLLRNLPGAGVFGGHVFTLPQFAARLAAQGELARAPLSQLSQQALTARAVFRAIHDKHLGYFDPVADRPGFVRALTRTIHELRLQEVDWGKLKRTGPPGEDLAYLAREYERELEDQALADLAVLYRAALAVVESGEHPWQGLPAVLWDLPVRHALEQRLVNAVARRAPSVHEFTLDAAAAADHPAIERVRRYLFAAELPQRAELDESVDCFSAPGEGLECIEIVRRVQALAEAGMPFDEMAVLLRAAERYQPLVEEAFRRGGVPVYLSRGGSRPDAAGRAFLALLVCAQEGCSATRFAEYLSLAQVPRVMKDGAPQRVQAAWTAPDDEVLASYYGAAPTDNGQEEDTAASLITPAGWERLLVDAAVVGGASRWRRRLQGLAHELRFQRAAVADDAERRQALDRRIERLQSLERFALPIIDLLDDLPEQATWGCWLERLTELAEVALRWPDSVVSVLRELQPMDAVGPVSLDEVYGVLEDRLRFLRRDPAHDRYGRVFVSSIEEARGRTFSVVFLPGLAEGIFPKRAAEDPLLLDVHRAKLKAGLATKDQRVADERELLRIAAAAGKRLVFSYPRIDVGQARPRVPSFYALEIMRAGEGRLPDLKEFEKRAASGTQARLGWPAPEDFHQAVDDAEYDLARLAQIQKLPEQERMGKGRYLVEANATLARSLRARWRRWETRKWTSADGLVDPDAETLAVLETHRLGARAYSATSLQQFAACPYRFFLYSIHHLREREEAAGIEQLDPLTRGALFHKVQHELFGELKRRELLPLTSNNVAAALDIADRVLDHVAGQYAEELAPAIPRVWHTEIEDIRSDLRGWLNHSSANVVKWIPLHSEFEFHTTIARGFRLRGAVDLIEESAEGLRVTDHKTGKPQSKHIVAVGGGKVLQPLLYALAVESAIGRRVTSGRLYYCTHRGAYDELPIVHNPATQAHALAVLEAIDASVAEGFLPAAPERDACRYCEYRAACGSHEELRVSAKEKDRLERLKKVRETE